MKYLKKIKNPKHLKLIVTILTFIAIYFIYILASPNDISYLALGDSFALGENPYGEVAYGYSDYLSNYFASNHHLKLYTKKFASRDARIKDVKQDILLNRKVYVNGKSVGLKSGLRDADIITLSIGANDLISEINMISEVMLERKTVEIIETIEKNLDDLVKEMLKYNKNIILIGYYNFYPTKENYQLLFLKLDKAYKKVCKQNKITYISLYDNFHYEKYLPNPFNIHPSIEGYEYMKNKIVENINDLLAKS